MADERHDDAAPLACLDHALSSRQCPGRGLSLRCRHVLLCYRRLGYCRVRLGRTAHSPELALANEALARRGAGAARRTPARGCCASKVQACCTREVQAQLRLGWPVPRLVAQRRRLGVQATQERGRGGR